MGGTDAKITKWGHQHKNMESDAGYGFLARVLSMVATVQRGALTPIEQGMDATKLPEKRLVWVGRASKVSDVPSIALRFYDLIF